MSNGEPQRRHRSRPESDNTDQKTEYIGPMTILPAAYLPSIEYCAHWAQERCVIDAHEHFVKRSERNRTRILTANGSQRPPKTKAGTAAQAATNTKHNHNNAETKAHNL